jgi:hypothetical protein
MNDDDLCGSLVNLLVFNEEIVLTFCYVTCFSFLVGLEAQLAKSGSMG